MTDDQKELIETKFIGVHALIQSSNDVQHEVNKNIIDTLARIEKQVIKTNGRVTCLENWRWKIVGISIGCAGIVGFLIKIFV